MVSLEMWQEVFEGPESLTTTLEVPQAHPCLINRRDMFPDHHRGGFCDDSRCWSGGKEWKGGIGVLGDDGGGHETSKAR